MKFKLKGLKRAPSSSLGEAFENIPINTTVLVLSCNRLFNKGINDLINAFNLTPTTVTILDLGGNLLGNMTTENLTKLFASIPNSITTLNLRRNNLWNKNGNDLATAFTALMPNVKRLVLGSNNFKDKKTSDLNLAFKAIPQSVTELDLSRSNLNLFSLKKLNQLKGSLPHIQKVILSHNEIEKMTAKQRLALANLFPNVKKLVFIDKHGKRLAPYLESNLARDLGLRLDIPSLLKQASFFVAKNKNNEQLKKCNTILNAEAEAYVASAFSY
ncbi:hypothetical protein ACQUW5_00980 [Legionella sp. CNM-1927-20]|uniref:hypothetical protein n=1 Tax=Legionella sp. CNM-1927-20 TaxID=3422221 RepID=UPI00403ADEE4